MTIDEPCIILPDEVSMDDLKLLIDFVYRGEIKFIISQISSLSKLAQMLGIPGLPGFTEVVWINNLMLAIKNSILLYLRFLLKTTMAVTQTKLTTKSLGLMYALLKRVLTRTQLILLIQREMKIP